MSRNRSRAREVALQLLFQYDLNPGVARRDLVRFAEERLGDEGLQTFALALYDGVRQHGQEVDARLAQAAENWRLHRMPIVDRNVLRVGAFELLYQPDTPAGVAINEAIVLAHRFGSADSPGFVNGVLDRINKETPREKGP
jgi:N utilization substance protein B